MPESIPRLNSADVRAAALDLDAWMVELRRDLHRIPEVGLDLPLTQRRVLDALAGLDLEITLGVATSSVVAVLRGAAPGPAVLLRGDMDALPLTERAVPDGPPISEHPGAMHACGHDLHTAMLAGAARVLCETRDRWCGDVVFMFQPGEEGFDGARYMIDEGVLDAAGQRVIAAYALHVLAAQVPHGVFATRAGTVLSAFDAARVTVRGRGGHPAQPHLAIDPIPAACEMILALQTRITRSIDAFDPVIITTTQLHAGTDARTVVDEVTFDLSIRSFSPDARAAGRALVFDTLEPLAAAHHCTLEIDFSELYGPTINHPAPTDIARSVISDVFGADRLLEWQHPWPASEDFSRVLDAVPGTFIGLGACGDVAPTEAANNHHPAAQFSEAVMVDGVTALVSLALATLEGATLGGLDAGIADGLGDSIGADR